MKKDFFGFTIIELLVVVSISIIFFGLSLARYNDYSSQLKLSQDAKKLIDVLELAKKKALSADLANKACLTFSGYRVTIASAAYSLNFNCGGTLTKIQDYSLTSNVTVTAGVGNYDFTPLMSNPVFPYGTITLSNLATSKSINIDISSNGVINLNERLFAYLSPTPAPPTSTPAPPTATPLPTAVPSTPTATPRPPTATPIPPTSTPVPPTSTPSPTPRPPTATPTPTAVPPTPTTAQICTRFTYSPHTELINGSCVYVNTCGTDRCVGGPLL